MVAASMQNNDSNYAVTSCFCSNYPRLQPLNRRRSHKSPFGAKRRRRRKATTGRALLQPQSGLPDAKNTLFNGIFVFSIGTCCGINNWLKEQQKYKPKSQYFRKSGHPDRLFDTSFYQSAITTQCHSFCFLAKCHADGCTHLDNKCFLRSYNLQVPIALFFE